MVNRPLTVSRAAFFALALAAVTLLSLRSVCDLWFTHLGGVATSIHATTLAPYSPLQHDADPSVQCCASVSSPDATAPLQAAVFASPSSLGLAPAAWVAVATSAVLTRQSHWLRAPPRSPQSFYLRSARILR